MSYGLQITNANSELVIDERFRVPSLLGRLAVNPQPYRVEPFGTRYFQFHALTSSAANGQVDPLTFWTIPETGDDTWYCLETAPDTQSAIIVARSSPGGTYPLPDAYVFATQGQARSGERYGLRVFTPGGGICFDSGLPHLSIKQISPYFGYPAETTDEQSVVFGSLPGTPAFFIPPYHRLSARARPNDPKQATSGEYFGFVRRSGSTLFCRLLQTLETMEDGPVGYTITYGARTGLFSPVIDAALYAAPSGGTGIGGDAPRYTLSSNTSSVNEGGIVTWTFQAQNTSQTRFDYSITGISADDLESGTLTGTLTLDAQGIATHAETLKQDVSFGEGQETLYFNIAGLSSAVVVNDTSVASESYYFSNAPGLLSEGDEGTITLHSRNIPTPRTITFEMAPPTGGGTPAGSADVTLGETLSYQPVGNFDHTLTYKVAADALTEGTEWFRVVAKHNGAVIATTGNIQISDTSQSSTGGYTSATISGHKMLPATDPYIFDSPNNSVWVVEDDNVFVYLTITINQGGADTPVVWKLSSDTNNNASTNDFEIMPLVRPPRDGMTDQQAQLYLAIYGDLKAAFGASNVAAAKQHWYNNGFNEKRMVPSDILPGANTGTVYTGVVDPDLPQEARLMLRPKRDDTVENNENLTITIPGTSASFTIIIENDDRGTA
ncbi:MULTISPECIES: hypothetical protein [unclassified Azospirillum]|uniref:hypothetical protein n=1 Tax=unclassified Azospirillum TaxID=2630922 RepID=UPI000B629B65|nr:MULTISPECIES: hypothetical protein [unclassified Azospirillum]SNS84026.1 hypothetical protein SAMN05880556_11337 [Azospirillum sp. RU38E]SNT01305.1 hypothetical protein SAMN05880591_11336 [Azospirillum sp. RU37A]